MTLNAMLLGALKPVVPTVAPGVYTGEETKYITFNYDLVPVNFSDNRTNWWKALIQVHLVLPLGENSVKLRADISSALVKADFTPPEIIDATDKDCQHYVFETESIISMKGE